MGTGFSKRKKETKALQQKFQQFQNEMQNMEVTGTTGQDLVTITLSGDGNLKKIKIKPECVDPEDVEGLEVLIKSAFEDAQKKLENTSKGMQGMTGLPDFGF